MRGRNQDADMIEIRPAPAANGPLELDQAAKILVVPTHHLGPPCASAQVARPSCRQSGEF
jgi:hypothetical protein